MMDFLKKIWENFSDIISKALAWLGVISVVGFSVFRILKSSENEEEQEIEDQKKKVEDKSEKQKDSREELEKEIKKGSSSKEDADARHKDRKDRASKFGISIAFIIFFPIFGVEADGRMWEVETSHGTEVIELPDGVSTEEAMLEFAVLYLEERKDYANLSESYDRLTERAEAYLTRTEELLQEKRELQRLYESALEPDLFSWNTNFGIERYMLEPGFALRGGVGLTILEEYTIAPQVRVSNSDLSLGIDFRVNW